MDEIVHQQTGQISQLKNSNWDTIIGSIHQPNEGNETLRLCCGNGANIVLCTEDGFKVTIHEILVRKFTKIFSLVGNTTHLDQCRDPYGLVVVVLQGVKRQTLKGLSEFLYTGVCCVRSSDTKDNVLSLLDNCNPDMQSLKLEEETENREEVNIKVKQEDDKFDLRMLDELSEGEAEEEERQLENIKKIILDDLQSEGTDNKNKTSNRRGAK